MKRYDVRELDRRDAERRAERARRLSWKPVRRGAIYCAPACGRGCTFAEYGAALKRGAKMATRLGRGWKVRVHENLGWHASAVSPCGRINVTGMGPYHAFLGSPTMLPAGEFAAPGATPEAAVAAVVHKAQVRLAELEKMVEGL